MNVDLRATTIGTGRAAACASRCRAAAREPDCDVDTRDALLRAADRYSGRVSELAGALVAEGSK